MGTDVGAQEKAVKNLESGQDGETPIPAPARSAEEKPEPTFDTGLTAWLQVVGSFFLFFNSWCVSGPVASNPQKYPTLTVV